MLRVLLLTIALFIGGCMTASQLEQASAVQFEEMRNEMTVSDNAADKAYVQCIADAIVAQLDEPYRSRTWDVELFDEDQINAFAMPGGQIGVFTGIFKTATDQDQLAAVMGHEVAHVTKGHSLKRANSQQAATVGILVGSVASEAVRDNVGLIVLGAQFGLLMPYGRFQESEADIEGLQYLAKAGFRPEASIELWENMAAENPSSLPQFLSTHPSSKTRIADLRAQLDAVRPIYQQAVSDGRRPNCSR